MGALSRLKHAWNAFVDQDRQDAYSFRPGDLGGSYGYRSDRFRPRISNERSIVSSIYNRMGVDVAAVDIRHVRLDDKDRFMEDINSGLNSCLQVEANIDQSGRAFKQDMAMTLFEEGVIAIVPVETSIKPTGEGSVDILSLRVGKITQWFPRHVKVDLYDDRTGRHRPLLLEKKRVAIVENPLYTVMNEPNSTLQRLIRKLALLDSVDEQSSSGKLDMIIQLPYVVRNDQMKARAEKRRQDIEFQLKGSQYGIAYTDGTEKITQLNRPAENNLLKQVEYLTEMVYGQLGITPEIMNGTADEKAMLNYNNRTIEPIIGAIADEMKRKFLSKTARTQRQSIEYFRDPFKLVPMSDLAEMADKFTRNEIVTSNEFRQFIGMKPSSDPKADELRNSNMPQADDPSVEVDDEDDEEVETDDLFSDINKALDDAFADLGVDEDEIEDDEEDEEE